MSTIVLCGGGTGGHIMPNLALIPELSKTFDRICYVGGNGMEKTLVPRHNIEFFETKVVKLDRQNMLANLKIPAVLHAATKQAKEILTAINASVVFSKGGYAALPSCYAAKALKIPIVIHESDYTMGVANKLVSRFADKTLTSFPETKGGQYIGTPIRQEIFLGNALRASAKYRLTQRPVILVFGGSLGAESINKAVYAAAPELTRTHNIMHITGKGGKELKLKGYQSMEYADDIADLYALAQVVVCRGGANSLAELAALGKRTLCIPLPKGHSRGDQLDNALSYQKRGYLDILPQSELCPETLITKVKSLVSTTPPLRLKQDSNGKIVQEILSVMN